MQILHCPNCKSTNVSQENYYCEREPYFSCDDCGTFFDSQLNPIEFEPFANAKTIKIDSIGGSKVTR